jgi:hypothetical protein
MLATRKLKISHLISIRKTLGILQFLNQKCANVRVDPNKAGRKINLILVLDIVFG